MEPRQRSGNVLTPRPVGSAAVPLADAPDRADDWIRQARKRLDAEPSKKLPELASSVLIPLIVDEGVPYVLYTRRAEHLPQHPGELSFPGGGRTPHDASLKDAALRETREEVGIQPRDVDVLGHAADLKTYYGRWIRAFAGLVDPDAVLVSPSTPGEVEERILVPLPALFQGTGEPSRAPGEGLPAGEGVFGHARSVDSYETRRLDEGGEAMVLHYWHLGPQTSVWGITGALTARFLERAYGWEAPAQARRIADRDDVMP